MKRLLLSISCCIFTQPVFSANSAPIPNTKKEHTMNTFINNYLPSNYLEVFSLPAKIDDKSAKLTRYQPKNHPSIQFGNEHFSVLVDESQLKGFAWLAPQLKQGKLPSKDEAQIIAEKFLQSYAPDLSISKEIHWIAPHKESIQVDGKTIALTGMKVKMRNPKDGLWFWIIVGKHNKPMIFERDIVWINFPGKRQTEKWLHDEWLKTQPNIPKR